MGPMLHSNMYCKEKLALTVFLVDFDSPNYQILFRIGLWILRHLAHSSPRWHLSCNWHALCWRAPVLHRTVRSSWNCFVNQSTGKINYVQKCQGVYNVTATARLQTFWPIIKPCPLHGFVPWFARMFIWNKRGSASSQWWISYLLLPTQRPGQAHYWQARFNKINPNRVQ